MSFLAPSFIYHLRVLEAKSQRGYLKQFFYLYFFLWICQKYIKKTNLKIFIKKKIIKFVSLVKGPKCHKDGKALFFYRFYYISIQWNFELYKYLSLGKSLVFFNYLKYFYFNFSSNLLFLKNLNLKYCSYINLEV